MGDKNIEQRFKKRKRKKKKGKEKEREKEKEKKEKERGEKTITKHHKRGKKIT